MDDPPELASVRNASDPVMKDGSEASARQAAAGGPFSILRFAEPELSDVVYLEQLTSALYIDKPTEVDRYLEVMERLCVQAETAEDTIRQLEKIHDELPC